jgi:hypothetical protein
MIRGQASGFRVQERWTSLRQLLVTIAAFVCFVMSSSGCGYSLAGRGSFLPASIRTIGVPLFVNRTQVFDIERQLTERVRSEFIGRGNYRVVPETAGADAVLTGTITSITLTPSSFNDQQQATRYVVTVTTALEFTEVASKKVLWSNAAWQFREEYQLTTATEALDPTAFFGQEGNALRRIADNFARSVVSAILEAF